MSTARRGAAWAPRNFLIKFTAPCGHRAIVCLKFACGYLLLCLKFAVQCGHSAVLKKILQCSAVAGRNLAVQCGHSAGKVCPRQLYQTAICLFLVQATILVYVLCYFYGIKCLYRPVDFQYYANLGKFFWWAPRSYF